MLTINQYVKASSLEEAYELNQKRSNVVLGGMLWLKMQKRNVGTAIDLSGLGLDNIEETESELRIGAMVTLRQMELHQGLNDLTDGAARESVRHIVGVQFRNMATVGGSVFGRYGFSDVLTFLMAAGAEVELYKRGRLSVEEFAYLPYDNDILTYVIVPKKPMRAAYLSQRNTKTDFPVLTCCAAQAEEEVRCVIGARPMKAVCLRDEAVSPRRVRRPLVPLCQRLWRQEAICGEAPSTGRSLQGYWQSGLFFRSRRWMKVNRRGETDADTDAFK